MDWPVATVLLGTMATLAVGIAKWRIGSFGKNGFYAKATDMAEIRARLAGLEQAHNLMRTELRNDIKELQRMVSQRFPNPADHFE